MKTHQKKKKKNHKATSCLLCDIFRSLDFRVLYVFVEFYCQRFMPKCKKNTHINFLVKGEESDLTMHKDCCTDNLL